MLGQTRRARHRWCIFYAAYLSQAHHLRLRDKMKWREYLQRFAGSCSENGAFVVKPFMKPSSVPPWVCFSMVVCIFGSAAAEIDAWSGISHASLQHTHITDAFTPESSSDTHTHTNTDVHIHKMGLFTRFRRRQSNKCLYKILPCGYWESKRGKMRFVAWFFFFLCHIEQYRTVTRCTALKSGVVFQG